MDSLLFPFTVLFDGLFLWAVHGSKHIKAEERDKLLGTLQELRPALELAASGATERFTATLTARYVNALSDLHCQSQLLGAVGARLDAMATALDAQTAKLVEGRLAVGEAQAMLATVSEAAGRARSIQPT